MAAIGLTSWYQFAAKPTINRLFRPNQTEIKECKIIHHWETLKPKHKPARDFYGNAVDTLGSDDTIYLYPSKNLLRHGYAGVLEIQVIADSLSGSTNGRVFFQESSAGLVWREAYEYKPTINNINGATTQVFNYVDETHLPRVEKLRVMVVSHQATQATKIHFSSVYLPTWN